MSLQKRAPETPAGSPPAMELGPMKKELGEEAKKKELGEQPQESPSGEATPSGEANNSPAPSATPPADGEAQMEEPGAG